ncbi:MAG: hypothetical protein V3T83_05435, partial [Acidobacteriota bacterium]
EANRFLAVVGASGSGKSSLVRAGLVPALQRGELLGSERWPIVTLRPGQEPLEQLAIALSACREVSTVDSPDAFRRELEADPHNLHRRLATALHESPPDRRVCLVVDQFEEAFALCENLETRSKFIDALVHAAGVARGRTVVVLTLRADFYSKCSGHPQLTTLLSDHQVYVEPMSDSELRDAIERPAQLVGCELEPGLTELLIRDFRQQSGGLPLLQHALERLWGKRTGRRLTLTAYKRDLGGLQGALKEHADGLFAQFSEDEKKACRHIFQRLVKLGEGAEDTRRQAAPPSLIPVGAPSETFEKVLESLTRERLLTAESDLPGQVSTVEIAHEELIRSWPKLGGWIEEDRDSLRVRERLSLDAEEWQRNSRDSSFLLRDTRLEVIEEWKAKSGPELNPLEEDFLKASQMARDVERRRRQEEEERREAALQVRVRLAEQLAKEERLSAKIQRRLAVTTMFLLAIVAGTLAFLAWQQQRDVTQKLAESYWYRANTAKENQQLAEASHFYSLAAQNLRQPDDIEMASMSLGLTQGKSFLISQFAHEGSVKGVLWIQGEARVLTYSDDGTARLWKAGDGSPVAVLKHEATVLGAVYGRDKARLLTYSEDGTARLWKAGDGSPVAVLKHEGRVGGAASERNPGRQ